VSKAREYLQSQVIDRLLTAAAQGHCGWSEISKKEEQALAHIWETNEVPYFLRRREPSMSFGRTDTIGCLINVGFWAPLNRLTCEIFSDDPEPAPCDKWPGRMVGYFWSEKKGGTARQGW